MTLHLISANVYNSVDALKVRGFSYIEIWIFGSQFPILLALVEYGVILCLKKIEKKENKVNPIGMKIMDGELIEEKPDFEEKLKKLDFATLIFSFVTFILFVIIYWVRVLFL